MSVSAGKYSDRAGIASGQTGQTGQTGRERIRRAAYDLFSRKGVRAVGIDTVIATAGTAKMTLYRNFPSKDELILDFLALREELWTRQWLITGIRERAHAPAGQLLALFDVLTEWFERSDFEGCAFLTTMLEINDRQHPVGRASVEHLANIREFLRELAAAAGIPDPDGFARQWHILMTGAIMAAHEGDAEAARRARELGELLLARHGITVDPETALCSGAECELFSQP
jgi:AcrR family transcriptional regulator